MHSPDENAAPPRSILTKLLVRKWEYRYPRTLLGLRLGAGGVTFGFGILLLRYRIWWGLLPLAAAALAFWGGPYIYKVTQSRPAA